MGLRGSASGRLGAGRHANGARAALAIASTLSAGDWSRREAGVCGARCGDCLTRRRALLARATRRELDTRVATALRPQRAPSVRLRRRLPSRDSESARGSRERSRVRRGPKARINAAEAYPLHQEMQKSAVPPDGCERLPGEAQDSALPIEIPRAARRAPSATRSDQAWITSGRPKVASAPGVRKVVISSMRAPRRVSTLMPCGMKLPPLPSQA
jgi:hypothetical protein